MPSTKKNIFDASESALGYLYQIRIALLLSLERLREDDAFLVSIEILDDVAFEKAGQPAEILQAKHHRTRQASLSDSSSDIWKSLRIWLEGRRTGSILEGGRINLLTTSTASAGSAASYLRRNDNRDIAAAAARLKDTALTSKNKQNAAVYKTFLGLTDQERIDLLRDVTVLDAAPHVQSVEGAIEAQLFWAVDRGQHGTFRRYLEGWWFQRSVSHIADQKKADRILAAEIEAQIADLREQFKQDALPIAADLLNVPPDRSFFAEKANATFVRQLKLAEANEGRIFAAIRDYYRAFEQRSRWLRDDLLVVGDLRTYERRLIEEWELVFEAVKNELGADAAEAAKQQAARKVLEWAERVTIPIRPRVTEPFVTRGSLHMLADDLRLGWHSNFRERLARILHPALASA